MFQKNPGSQKAKTSFYLSFEDAFRGSYEVIRGRLQVYEPFLGPVIKITGLNKAVDLGCGRGEWLRLLQQNGFDPIGIDLDEGMLSASAQRGFRVVNRDATEFLREAESNSFAVISAFHLVEHLSFETLRSMIDEAFRCLAAGGLLIFETPNPENLHVGATTFYLDPTHQRPLPPELLRFAVEYGGFARVKTIRLNEQPRLRAASEVTAYEMLTGPSPDYAIVAQKAYDAKRCGAQTGALQSLEAAFAARYGVTLEELAARYDAGVNRRLQDLDAGTNRRLLNVDARMDRRLLDLDERIKKVENLDARIQKIESRRLEDFDDRIRKLELRRPFWVEQALAAIELRARELYWTVTRFVGLSHWHDGSRYSASTGNGAANGLPPEAADDFLLKSESGAVRIAYLRLRAAAASNKPRISKASTVAVRPRLACVSPIPPQKTGVADYSAQLIKALAQYYDIDVIIARELDEKPSIPGASAIHDATWFEANALTYDRILYHVGNSSFHSYMIPLIKLFPGVVVAHDFFLGDLLNYEQVEQQYPHAVARALYNAHGYPALAALRGKERGLVEAIENYPANLFLFQQAQAVIVHNDFARELTARFYGNVAFEKCRVVPHARKLADRIDRDLARKELNIRSGDFIVCSFGFMSKNKMSDRIASAWAKSSLSHDPNAQLIFVGAAPDASVSDKIAALQRINKISNISITGYVSPSQYLDYLAISDAAVQLRTNSRGESSGALLYCMSYGLPAIINSHGPFAEIDADTVIKLSEQFSDLELAESLEKLANSPDLRARIGAKARAFVERELSLERSGELYHDIIETCASTATPLFDLRALAGLGRDFALIEPEDLKIDMARRVTAQYPLTRYHRQLLIDVSAVVRVDLKSGIQRVVRAQLLGLLDKPPPGFRVEAIYLAQQSDKWSHRYARKYVCELLGLQQGMLEDELIEYGDGDIYYMPDYFNDGVSQAQKAGVFDAMRDAGVKLNFLVHDNLPIEMPELFPRGTNEVHENWLRAVCASADQIICISNAVMNGVERWLDEKSGVEPRPRLSCLHHGADVEASSGTVGLPANAAQILEQLASRPTFLMVGTIEPRKGYLQALAAFERLWEADVDVNLAIVGAEGWTTAPNAERRTIPQIVRQLKSHPKKGERLFWLKDSSDEFLEEIYGRCACLIAASEDEGFGLPLVEAARRRLAILARDIPVFREVGDDHVTYFRGADPADLAAAVDQWLRLYRQNAHRKSDGMPWITWAQNVERLKVLLLERRSAPERADIDHTTVVADAVLSLGGAGDALDGELACSPASPQALA